MPNKPSLLSTVATTAIFAIVVAMACQAVSHRGCIVPPRNACIANLKFLDGAKATWAIENGITNLAAVPRKDQIYGATKYIRDEPQCPGGGHYWLGRLCDKPQCTIPGHTL